MAVCDCQSHIRRAGPCPRRSPWMPLAVQSIIVTFREVISKELAKRVVVLTLNRVGISRVRGLQGKMKPSTWEYQSTRQVMHTEGMLSRRGRSKLW
ncbi:hypothetical protein PISMIDRAFT_467059 [Pisolithus microcarpus 441]|uniref:Uncharacterized protein n=1 Tax=Pisolithus microcarpus 441 TaxID=765257 RepID=A0A0C9YDZ4_9AGAM|nr:hypothetical protein PISMIDRAFT_467059 [Pisolithus microcarpus 441]